MMDQSKPIYRGNNGSKPIYIYSIIENKFICYVVTPVNLQCCLFGVTENMSELKPHTKLELGLISVFFFERQKACFQKQPRDKRVLDVYSEKNRHTVCAHVRSVE